MVKGWQGMPPLSEFKWLLMLDKLLVVHQENSLVIYAYSFQSSSTGDVIQISSDLTGSAIGGISKLLREILESKEKIQEIDHGDKKIYFAHGDHTVCVLIASGSSAEFQYRLNLFSLMFEKRFGKSLEGWDGDRTEFKTAREFIMEAFT